MLEDTLKKMKKASVQLANADSHLKNKALDRMAELLKANQEEIINANKTDLEKAEREQLDPPLIKRLKFDAPKLDTIIHGLKDLIKLEDPANKVISKTLLDEDLILSKVSVPIGIIGIIFESRPDALVQIASLCIKSGNCAILKGGIEALNTNRILADIINQAILEVSSVFQDTIHLIERREDVHQMLAFNQYISLIIPRGSNQFVQYIQKNTSIPVLGHADGICHMYIDKNVNTKNAVAVTIDAKTQYVSVCNAIETLLVHADIAPLFLPELYKQLKDKVQLKGCKVTKTILPDIEDASEEDWLTEYLDYILSIKVVKSISEAINHINTYGSGHTDAIMTEHKDSVLKFKSLVDSANVMVNCSTRFADGFRYGFGAEVGISTNKIHARGPVGLEGMVIYKYLLEGKGQIVADYTGENAHRFIHKKIY
ncbi:MAG: glutamate-5-semialdehyde dehydrogenase [Spirochaetes bacterium]|nr:glutamate-5-semialdehyde dehydrogenase [Spirochaetota bacterium]